MKKTMKKINILLALTFAFAFGLTSCNVLDEQPRSSFDPSYFATDKGVEGGLTSLYAELRSLYGNGYVYSSLETGTDEYTYGQSGGSENFMASDFTGTPMTPTNSDAGRFWDVFPYINTASGVIQFAEEGGMDKGKIAEAYFFRAFYYFHLVRNFGGVPLDLGAGELQYNTNSTRTSVRNTVAEVYRRCIFPDLEKAVNDLPNTPRVTGAVTKTVARTYLAKAYLTYAWWLENPRGIPTYPEINGKSVGYTDIEFNGDPAHDAKYYFQKAYDTAMAALTDTDKPYDLEDCYYDVNVPTNDRNKEWLLWADHTEQSDLYNGVGKNAWGNGAAPENFTSWFPCCNYTLMSIDGTNPVQRDLVPGLGRPWTRMAPIIEVFTKTFADKKLDSRYDGTFTYIFRANWQKAAASADKVSPKTLPGANGLPINPGEWGAYAADIEGHNYGLGDAVLTFLDENDDNVKYDDKNAGVCAGVLPGRADFVINPRDITRQLYPVLWKIGPYRTDNGTGFGAGVNSGSTRPFVIAKYSELFFIAAEANVKGATAISGNSARELLLNIRKRASHWRWDNNNGEPVDQDDKARGLAEKAMEDATPQVITIDYILDERSREYFGEGHRWYELARTQTWDIRAAEYTMGGMSFSEHKSSVVNRTIKPENYLRPIPQGQIDALEMSADEKKAYQNPEY